MTPSTSRSGLPILLFVSLVATMRGDNIHFPTQHPYKMSVGGIWPRPQKQEVQDQYVAIVDPFKFKIDGQTCDILTEAVTRYSRLLDTNWRNHTQYDMVNTAPSVVGKTSRLRIRLMNACETYPQLNMDEKYTLEITKGTSVLQAESIWGILRGLETFSQLAAPSLSGEELIVQVQKIEDFPQYPHRGLLIDSSRHYLPVQTIKKQLDILSYHKMNVLHWHIVDDQSFPYQSKKFPSLSQKGAYGPDAIYTESNIQDIVEYARLRGIRVIPEFDNPGHTDSWDAGMPQVHCHTKHPNATASPIFIGALDPLKNETYQFIHDLFTEVKERFPEKYIHIGGDEVDPYCWEKDATIKAFMTKRNWNGSQLQSYYEQRVLKNLEAISSKAIVWEEVFENWSNYKGGSEELNAALDNETIIQTWKENSPIECVKAVAKHGYKVITSCGWYLDALTKDFKQFYENNLNNADLEEEDRKLLIGGEACMWGEKVDHTNIESRVWPRASAIAEHLWSASVKNDENDNHNARISEHVCRLRRRGVQASPAHMFNYCSDVLPRSSMGGTGRFFNAVKDVINLIHSDDEEDDEVDKNKYETVKNSPDKQEKKPATTGERSNAPEKPSESADNDESAAVGQGTSVLLLIGSLVLLKLNF